MSEKICSEEYSPVHQGLPVPLCMPYRSDRYGEQYN